MNFVKTATIQGTVLLITSYFLCPDNQKKQQWIKMNQYLLFCIKTNIFPLTPFFLNQN